MNFEEFVISTKDIFNVELTEKQKSQFKLFLDEFVKTNSHTNLSAIREPEDILQKHFLDAVSCVPILKRFQPKSLIDVGTGGGMPGIPLKILFPEMQVCLADSVQRKTAFLSDVVEKMEWNDVDVLTERAELIGRMEDYREKYDLVIARALAAMPTLVEYLLPLVKVGGHMIAQKGNSAFDETEAARNGIELLGGNLIGIEEINLPGIDEKHYFVIVEKISTTDGKYPRRVGIPSKRPL